MCALVAMARMSDEKIDFILDAEKKSRDAITKSSIDTINIIPDKYIRIFIVAMVAIPVILAMSPIVVKIILYASVAFLSIAVIRPGVFRKWMCMNTEFMFYLNPIITKLLMRALRKENISATEDSKVIENAMAELMRARYIAEATDIIGGAGNPDRKRLKILDAKISVEEAILIANGEHCEHADFAQKFLEKQ